MIAVTGATGTIGRELVRRLLDEGQAVAAVTRNPEASGLPYGARVVWGDPSRPRTLASALSGVTALFLHPRAAGDAASELVAIARAQGAARVVALSAMNVDEPTENQPSRYRGDRNKEAELAAVHSGLEWVSLRASSFASNAIGMWGAQIRAGDVVRYVYAAFEEALIDERDVAEVAARALLADSGSGLLRRRLELTGAQSLSHEAMVGIIGTAVGRPLRYEELAPEVVARGMVQHGMPEPFVTALMARYARELGTPARVTGAVEEVLGRPPRTFAQWAADNAAAFRARSSEHPEPLTVAR